MALCDFKSRTDFFHNSGNVLARPRLVELVARFSVENSLTAGPRSVRQNVKIVREFLYMEQIESVAGVTAAAVKAFLVKLAGLGRSPKTVLNAKGSVSAFCRHLEDAGLLEYNPCVKVRLRRPPRVPAGVISGRARVEELLAACAATRYGPALRNIVALALATGLRLSELCRLKWLDVDEPARALLVGKAKNGQPRVIPLNALGLDALARQRTLTGAGRWVFPAREAHGTLVVGWKDKPASPNIMCRHLRPVAARFPEFRQLAGKSIGRGFHLCRHTWASNLAAGNVSPSKIQAWGGWSSLQMVERYTHLARVYDPAIEKASI